MSIFCTHVVKSRKTTYICVTVIDEACDQNLNAYIYKNVIMNDRKSGEAEKQTWIGPGAKVLPSETHLISLFDLEITSELTDRTNT